MSTPALGSAAECAAPVDPLEQTLADGRAMILRVLAAGFARLSPEEREDIAQELLVQFWHQRERIANPEAWLYIAARHRGISAMRRQRAHPHEELSERDHPVGCADDGRDETVRRLFLSLQGECRRLLGNLLIAGWTLRELAKAGQCSLRQVHERRTRCIKSLRRRWQESTADRGAS